MSSNVQAMKAIQGFLFLTYLHQGLITFHLFVQL